MADPQLPVVDLSDLDAQFFCLSCGAPLARERSRCGSCDGEALLSRKEIVKSLEASARERAEREDFESISLGPLPLVQAQHVDAAVAFLQEQEIPHLLVDAARRLTDSKAAACAIMVPAADLPFLRSHQRAWDDREGPGAAAHADDTVLLVRTDKDLQRSLVRSRLEEARVPFVVKQGAPQFGFDAGLIGAVEFHVERADLARAEECLDDLDDEPVVLPEAEDAEGHQGETTSAASPPDDDDMEAARLERRYRIARWFLVLPALPNAFFGALLVAGGHMVPGVLEVALGISLLWLAAWSRKQPRRAFGWAFVVLLVCAGGMVLGGSPLAALMIGAINLAAAYWAYKESVNAGRALSVK